MATSQMTAPTHTVGQPPIERGLWWLQPLVTVVVLGGFVGYGLWSVIVASTGYAYEPYLSPFYSPLIQLGFWPLSPAILIAGFPLGFRFTCYYYRKAYYRSFFWDPPACAIPELGSVASRAGYTGERQFPQVLFNLHRFFLYAALVVVAFLAADTVLAFRFANGFGVGLGSLLFLVNVVFLGLYTFSCHSLRHLVGGGMDCFSCSRARYSIWQRLSVLNGRHGTYAWISLFTVVATDLYVRLLAAGVISDPRLF